MAKRYRPVLREHPFLLPPDMRDWLPAAHPVHVVIEAVSGHLDTSAFHAARRTGHAGRAGYDPDMLVTLLIWGYGQGLTSSRRIEAACWQDVAFRLICAGDVPDHVTISRFRSAFPGAVEELFAQVLGLCARLGMGRLGVIALDGMKIAASASASANRTEDTLRKMAADLVAGHGAADAAEDDLFGPGRRGDQVPGDVADPRTRAGRIAAALAQLEAGRDAARAQRDDQGEAYLQEVAAGRKRRGGAPAVAEVAAAAARLAAERAAAQARADQWQARRQEAADAGAWWRGANRRPAGPDASARVRDAAAALEAARARQAGRDRRARRKAARSRGPVRNITDVDSRLMPVRGGGFIQGYNAQNVTSADGLIIATRLTAGTADTPWYQPMITAALDAAALITARRAAPASSQAPRVGLVLADAGYLSLDNLTAPGPDRLIATGKRRALEKTARQATPAAPASPSPPIAAMAARLAAEPGITAYRQRGHIAETPHGQIKHNMRFRQLSVRGHPKASAEWTFVTTAHNLYKAISTGHLTLQALAALTT